MGAGNTGRGGGGSNRYEPPKKKTSIKSVKPLAISIVKGLDKQRRAAKQNLMDYEGAAAGVTKQRTNADAMREREEGTLQSSGRLDNPILSTKQVVSSGIVTNNGIVAPTTAEVSQSAAADAETYDLRKTKKKGRSMTTLTSSKGVTDDKLTLGKPSLLGA